MTKMQTDVIIQKKSDKNAHKLCDAVKFNI